MPLPHSTSEDSASPWHQKGERQHQQRAAKRDAVLRTAARLFTRQGFHRTSLDDIAASLQVTKPTLYHYIESKEEILFACAQQGLDALRDQLARGTAEGLAPRARLEAAIVHFAEIATSDFGLCVIRVGEEPLSEVRRRDLRAIKGKIDAEFRALIAQCMADGSVARGDPGAAAINVVGAISAIGRWYQPEEHSPHSLRQAISHCISMLMHGVLEAPATGASMIAAPSAADTNNGAPQPVIRRELHFGNRLLRCFEDRPRNLARMLAKAVAERPEAEALVCGDLRLSWRALHHAATRCAGGLAQRGVRPGDRVTLVLPNQTEFVIVALACAWLGAVLMPFSYRAGAVELGHAINDSESVAIICSPELIPVLPPADQVPALRLRFSTEPVAAPGFEPLAALMQGEPLLPPHDADEEDLAVLMYTSGTTGRPKGSMLTHLNIAHSVLHYQQAMNLTSDGRAIVAVPMSHVTGLVALVYTQLHTQGTTILMPHFKASEFVRLAARERMTHTVLVPAMYNLCLLLPDLGAHDLSAWRIGAYGGAAMPTAAIQALAQHLPKLVLMNAYGATETCSPATLMPAGQTESHRDSVGLPVTCGDVLVADDAGRELPRGEIGEIWIGGPMVIPGYWRNIAATAAEFSSGYWRSGDIGSQDAEGFVRVLDRKKDVINRGGYKVLCVTVENALGEHPGVVEAALVGVPCTVLGERVHAYVCVRALDESTQAAALAEYCASRVADYAVPETWTIGTEPLPRNANGKVMKRLLRESLHPALS